MTLCRITALTASALVAIAWPSTTQAQRSGVSARNALNMVASQYGPSSVQWVAEIQGARGIPQPATWEISAYDANAPRLLRNFWASSGRAGGGELDQRRYPLNLPVGYFSPNQIAVDSSAAFTVAEGEARKAQIAFDSCHYLLRAGDNSTEPVWRLELYDAREMIVGKIYLSAASGRVFRTMWVYRDNRARRDGLPLIVDSMAPGNRGTTITSRQTAPPNPNVSGFPEFPGADSDPYTASREPLPNVSTNTPPPPAPRPYTPAPPTNSTPPVIPPAPAQGGGTGIPDPPAVNTGIPDPPASGGSIPDLRAPAASSEAVEPPIDVPESSGGSSERIPPPPIPTN